ncbi:hypothetical protein RO575_12320 [Methylomonas sp. MO1]|uniref:hypothetical protein n=1 Tax=Methylomonas sp. MO1 TaxID=3073619 RepID=UPI0028A407A3|nr:hypothetical protein [Methylomonas sp. MO1]MDT4290348.1 hypothetical protein [Methylomonas sp. MO1]
MSLLIKLKHEAQEVGLVTLYFFFCFSVMLTLKKLLLADYQVDVQVVSLAAVSALIIAKVVVILDHTAAGNRFDTRQPLWVAALYKTLVYLGIAFMVFFLEKVFHAYRETGLLNQAVSEVWAHKDWNLMLMKLLCVGLTFLAYHVYAGLDQRLGEGTLRRGIFERPQPTHGPGCEG